MNSIWAHTIVKNEERYLWFAVMSIIDYVDKIIIYDTGSTDKTLKIIEEIRKIKKDKIIFQEVGSVDVISYPQVRQKMLDQTKGDWLLIVDGDEVWWEDSIKKLTNLIRKKSNQLDSIVTPFYNIVGDIFHYQEEAAGNYVIDDRKGHINIRAVNRRIPGLHFEKPHGQLGLYNKEGVLIQEMPKNKRIFSDTPYMHFTNMIRSSSRGQDKKVPKRSFKLKYEIGKKFPEDFLYPEVFYKPFPSFVSSPFKTMSKSFYIKSLFLSLPRKVKRRILHSKSGY